MRTQQQNLIRLQTALGKDAFFVTHLNASLAMSSMEHFILNAYSDTLHNVQPTEIIGTSATITVFGENGAPQYFDSYVTAFKKGSPALTGQGTPYTIELKPWLHFLDHESDCRIFQNMTVTDVLDKILAPYGGMGAYSLSLSNPHPLKRYQVQYNETNLAFFNRICHYSGLAYYIEHSNGSHILNVIDTDGPLGSLSPAVLDYQAGTAIRDHLSTWERNSRYATGNFEQRSYNYKIPSNLLINNQPASGEIAGVPRVPDTSHYRYIEDFDNQGDMSASSTTRITQVTSSRHAVSAGGDYRCLKVGKNFSAKPIPGSSPFPDKGKPFTIVQLSLTATNDSEFQSTLGAIPKGELCYPHYEPSLIHSLQTAVVTGPPGEEIYTDQEGRIKVQFHWDRLGKKDQDSTCWLRVMQSFSGPEFGGHFTPRIGQEVVVAFENGNPDRPFVLGGLHHTEHIPPFVIDNGLRAGFRTRSSKGGAIKQCNEISFYDAMGSEEFFIHAQKDHNSKVLHNRAERIDNHEIASIGGNRSLEVEGNQQQKVGGAMNLSIGGGPGSSVLGMVAGVLAAGSGDAMKGSGGAGNALVSMFVGALATASALAETLSLPKNKDFNNAADHIKKGGKDQSATGDSLGNILSKIMPISGVFNTVVEKFKSDTIGLARTEQIGVYKNTTVGHTQTTNVGDTQTNNIGKKQSTTVGEECVADIGVTKTTNVGEVYDITAGKELRITVGQASLVMKEDGTVLINGTRFNFESSGPVQLSGKNIDLN